MGSSWFTTLEALRRAEPEWGAIAAYREPVARFLRRVYPRLAPDLVDDVVQEVLYAMRTGVVARFDPDRGRFRDYLRGVVRNTVKRRLAEVRRAETPLDPDAVDPDQVARAREDELERVDLEATIIRAVRRFHDELLQAGEREVLYCFADRLLEGLTYEAIARKEGLPTTAVKRRLQAARRGVLRALLAGALEEAELSLPPRRLGKLAEGVQRALASGRPLEEELGRWRDPASRDCAAAVLRQVRVGVRSFPGLDSPDGQAFVSALRAVLEPDEGTS